MFQAKFVEKIKTHILCSVVYFPPKIVTFMKQCGKKYGKVGEVTDNIIRRMRTVRWIPKSTNAHSEHVILIAFPMLAMAERKHLYLNLNDYTLITNLMH